MVPLQFVVVMRVLLPMVVLMQRGCVNPTTGLTNPYISFAILPGGHLTIDNFMDLAG